MDKPLRFCLELELCAKNSLWTAHTRVLREASYSSVQMKFKSFMTANIKTFDNDFTFHLALSGRIDDTSCPSSLPDINGRYHGSGVARRRGPAVRRSPRSLITFRTSNNRQNQTRTSRSEKSADRRAQTVYTQHLVASECFDWAGGADGSLRRM